MANANRTPSTPQAASAAKVAETLANNVPTGGVAAAPVPALIPAFNMPKGIKAVKVLALPSLNLKESMGGMFLKIQSDISVSDVVDRSNQRDPALICDVQRLELDDDGTVTRATSVRWLVPAVVFGNIVKNYAADDASKAAVELVLQRPKGASREERVKNQRDVLAAAKLQIKGKIFAVQNVGKRSEGQNYNDFTIAEVELEAA